MRRRSGKKRLFSLIIPAALILLCAAGLLCSRYGLTVADYDLPFTSLPESFDGFRIVQLSDMHGSGFGDGNSRLLSAVAAQEPDVIVLTGDFLDESKAAQELPELDGLCRSLTGIAPTYFVSGNHDWASGMMAELAAVLEDGGVRYLRNEYVLLERGGDSIVLAGVEDPNGWADQPAPDEFMERVRAAQPDAFTVLLGHRNYWAQAYPALSADLILCGHSHGGIIRLPWLGGVIGTDATLFPEYDRGVFYSGRYTLVISGGLGNSVPVPRFLNTPEIVAVTLRAGAGS